MQQKQLQSAEPVMKEVLAGIYLFIESHFQCIYAAELSPF